MPRPGPCARGCGATGARRHRRDRAWPARTWVPQPDSVRVKVGVLQHEEPPFGVSPACRASNGAIPPFAGGEIAVRGDVAPGLARRSHVNPLFRVWAGLPTPALAGPGADEKAVKSWERGTNDNTNRLIRRYLPTGTPITSHRPYLDAIAYKPGNCPRAPSATPPPPKHSTNSLPPPIDPARCTSYRQCVYWKTTNHTHASDWGTS